MKLACPAAVGVPLIMPPGLSERLAGKDDPVLTAQV
jgi:hypothetical protein